ncbi:MAG: glycoside hydrolase family protein [Candidatus Methylacidiphilales bacterium]|nr:glycoside hydrolase family protein [Candidatus Methylacidiphilales bacterium]
MSTSVQKLLLGVVCFLSIIVSLKAGGSQKQGIGFWSFKGAGIGLNELGASWCYNWQNEAPADLRAEIEFVPMIWDEKDVQDSALKEAKKHGTILLGFNEPDHLKQANMSVELALKLWPQLEATGMRLGSPSTAGGADKKDSWFGQFMRQSMERGYRIDFVCVHYYESNFSDPIEGSKKLKAFLESVYGLYNKPIWLTEFALSNWKTPAHPDQQRAYMEAVLPMLESLPFVERYAWFALPPNPHGDEGALAGSNLCDNEGKLNSLGKTYQRPNLH